MPKKKYQKFAQLTLDSTFKRTFAQENSKELMKFLLNTFLAEKLRHPIKEITIINSELLGKTIFNRNSLFDVYCEDTTGTRFIVEIQVGKQEYFIKRTFFYLCTAIANYAKKGKKFDFNIPKLYSVSFLEFDLNFGENCTEEIQHLSIRNDKHPEINYDMLQMTFVLLPRFKKSEDECKTIMDKILFTFKNGHKLKSVPKNFTEKELLRIFDIAKISNFNRNELAKHEVAKMNRDDYKATIAYAQKKGEAKGKAKGKAEGFIEAAKAMLAKGYSVSDIMEITNLSRNKIMALR